MATGLLLALMLGIAARLGGQVRAIVEARWYGLIGTTAGPPWIVPITVGLRF